MSDPTDDGLAPKADEAGDGAANIDQQAGELQSLEGPDVETPSSEDRQADGDFPIMS